MVADVSYVGSASSNQLSAGGSGAPSYQIPLNGRTYGYRWRQENLDPTNVISGVRQPYAENQANQLRPMVGLGNVTMYSQIGESIFHSLQVSLNKRRGAAGLSYGIAYTYQFVNQALRSLDPFIADIPADHPHSNNNDLRNTNEAGKRPHFLTINYAYQVPNLSSAWDTPVAKVLDDWQVSGVTTITSAQWGTATYSYTNVPRELSAFVGNTGGINAPGSRVHFTCDPNLPRGERTMERQFRTECVAPPTDALYLGDSVGDELHLANNNLGFINWDISLFKNVPLGGSRNLQLRVEFYNAFNSDQWTGVDTSAQFDYLTGEQVDANFGTLTGSTRDARRIQLAARFTF